MFYDYNNKSQRIDYTLGPSEIIDFDRVIVTTSFVSTQIFDTKTGISVFWMQ
jgi:hypothetical protein